MLVIVHRGPFEGIHSFFSWRLGVTQKAVKDCPSDRGTPAMVGRSGLILTAYLEQLVLATTVGSGSR